jgi:hypothetical protein
VAIRKKLRAFKQGVLRDLVLTVVVGVLLPGITVALLLDGLLYAHVGFASLAFLLPGGVINLIKLLPRTKEPPARGTRKGQPRTVHRLYLCHTPTSR